MAQPLLDQAADKLYQDLDQLGGDLLKLPSVQQPVAILYTVQAIIDNGGFPYLFENDLPHQPPYSVISNAYRAIGASNAADSFDKAVAMFPFPSPEKDQAGRLAFMETLDESSDFIQLSDRVCGDEQVWTLLESYVRDHPSAFSR